MRPENDYKNDADPKGQIFIARQPIFDKHKKVYAYELLYRSNPLDYAQVADDSMATLKVMANSLLFGLQKLTGGKRAFIHFDQELVRAEIPLIFPNELLAVQIPFIRRPGERLVHVCNKIKKRGYPIVLDHVIYQQTETHMPFIQLADIVKVDFRKYHPELIRSTPSTRRPGVMFLAEKVETQEDYQMALDSGYDYFQGFFFQKPHLISRQEMPGYKVNYMRMLQKISDPMLDFSEIEEIIKHDVSLTYKLLRFINSAAYGFRVTVRSVGHALLLLGKREVRKWLSVIVMSGIGSEKPLELMNTAIIRGRFLELVAEQYKLPLDSWEFFLVGIFSMMDAFLDRPLEEILDELPLEDTIKAALMGEDKRTAPVLSMIEEYEKGRWEPFTQYAYQLNMDVAKLSLLYLDAVEWTKFLAEE